MAYTTKYHILRPSNWQRNTGVKAHMWNPVK